LSSLRHCVLVVDGQSEIRSFKKRFQSDFGHAIPGLRKHPGSGGIMTPAGYAQAALGILEFALRQRFTRILCVTDREKRQESAEQYAARVREAILDALSSSTRHSLKELDEKLLVCVADRKFENWIVADVEGITRCGDLIRSGVEQDEFEGSNGEETLKRLMTQPYRKIKHAPKLFNHVRFDVASANSPSFRRFLNATGLDKK